MFRTKQARCCVNILCWRCIAKLRAQRETCLLLVPNTKPRRKTPQEQSNGLQYTSDKYTCRKEFSSIAALRRCKTSLKSSDCRGAKSIRRKCCAPSPPDFSKCLDRCKTVKFQHGDQPKTVPIGSQQNAPLPKNYGRRAVLANLNSFCAYYMVKNWVMSEIVLYRTTFFVLIP